MTNRNNFDFIRLVAATMVIIGHAYALLALPGVPVFFRSSVSAYAVKVFFVISGFLVVTSWRNDPHVLRFLIKRALRIWPALVIVVVLSALVIGPLVTNLPLDVYFAHPAFDGYFHNIRFHIRYALPGVFETNIYPYAVNGSLWSLPVELAMYLVVPACGAATMKLPSCAFAMAWGTLTAIALAVHTSVFVFGATFVQGMVIYATSVPAAVEISPYFMVGGCIALAGRWLPLVPLVGLGLLGVGIWLAGSPWSVEPLLVFITSYAVIALGTASFPLINRTGQFGDISYGVFLWGFPIAQILSWIFGYGLSLWEHTGLTIVLSYAAALASWHLVEKPALSFKPRAKNS
jgi:peptidoglycan/LPS O-acetylase OafA/YrhL